MPRPQPDDAVVVAATRSPIGRANKGSLVDKRADELRADIPRRARPHRAALLRLVAAGNVAAEHGVTRADMDAFATLSQERAVAAQAAGGMAMATIVERLA